MFPPQYNFPKNMRVDNSHQMFQMVDYPLGSKSTIGKWRACAIPIQYFNPVQVLNFVPYLKTTLPIT